MLIYCNVYLWLMQNWRTDSLGYKWNHEVYVANCIRRLWLHFPGWARSLGPSCALLPCGHVLAVTTINSISLTYFQIFILPFLFLFFGQLKAVYRNNAPACYSSWELELCGVGWTESEWLVKRPKLTCTVEEQKVNYLFIFCKTRISRWLQNMAIHSLLLTSEHTL